ncbi:MAG: hypothetical protein Q8Q20_01560 [bacterium]|nr:hypothetical protein [bacterium]
MRSVPTTPFLLFLLFCTLCLFAFGTIVPTAIREGIGLGPETLATQRLNNSRAAMDGRVAVLIFKRQYDRLPSSPEDIASLRVLLARCYPDKAYSLVVPEQLNSTPHEKDDRATILYMNQGNRAVVISNGGYAVIKS